MVGSSNATLTTQLTATDRYIAPSLYLSFSLSLAPDCAITIAIVLALLLSLSRRSERDDVVSAY